EGAAALARRYIAAGYEVGLAWPGGDVAPAPGPGHLRRLLGATSRLAPVPARSPAPIGHRGAPAVGVSLGPPRVPPRKARTERLEDAAAAGRGKLTLRSAQRTAVFGALGAAFASVALSGEMPAWAIAAFATAGVVGFGWGERGGKLLRHSSTVV